MKSLSRARFTARRIVALLERERQLLLSGDYGAAEPIEAQLSREAAILEGYDVADDPVLADLLDRISQSARHNCSLAKAAQKGLQTGARMHEELRRKRDELATYTGTGRRLDHNAPRGSSDRRA